MPPNASSCVAARQGSHFFWAERHAEVAQFVSEVQGDRLREQGGGYWGTPILELSGHIWLASHKPKAGSLLLLWHRQMKAMLQKVNLIYINIHAGSPFTTSM